MMTRRNALARGALLAGGAMLTGGANVNTSADSAESATQPSIGDGEIAGHRTAVTTLNGRSLPFKIIDGVKVFHLVAEEIEHEFAPGLSAHCWGYNGQTPGPTIEAIEGDRCRFYVTNKLPAKTTVHWHGLRIPNGMDGVNGLTQKSILPGETYRYEFTVGAPGTFMYHPHFDEMTQQGMGMMGMLIVHPKDSNDAPVDQDFAIMLSEWRIEPGTRRPNTNEMTDFNIFTMNSRIYPATNPLVIRTGERVRIRFGNLSAMDHHPIHLHGFQFKIAEMDGGRIAPAAQMSANTVLVPVGSTRAIEFVADAPGDWAMHCHMTHHVMTQMGHTSPNMVGVNTKGLDRAIRSAVPNYMTMGTDGMGAMADMQMSVPKNSLPMIGADGPFETIDMSGMFTILKVRDSLKNDAEPGWYQQPAGSSAAPATENEMQRDGIQT